MLQFHEGASPLPDRPACIPEEVRKSSSFFALSTIEKMCFYSYEFLDKLIGERNKRNDHVRMIVEFLSYKNELVSEKIANVIIRCLY